MTQEKIKYTKKVQALRAVIIVIGLLFLGLGAWLIHLSTQSSSETGSISKPFFNANLLFFFKVLLGAMIVGPLLAYLNKHLGVKKTRKVILYIAGVLLLIMIIVVAISTKQDSNRAVKSLPRFNIPAAN